jgi:hypothetical protein
VRRARVGHGNRYETRLAYEPFNASTLIRTTRPNAAPEPPPATGTFTYRLLPPRAVEVRVRDGRPAFVGADAVLECAGPWRVDEAWWSGTLGAGGVAVTQDAYDVLLAGGTLCRLFKESGHWYIGGVYD